MFGFAGSSFLLNSFVAWQSNRTWGTVSYGWLQLRHIGGCWGLNRFRWKFNFVCPVLSWKMVHWSCLFNKLIQSLGIGFSMWVCITLPVFPSFHLFSHTSLNLFLMICLAVERLQGFFTCSFWEPSLASLSALSFPAMSSCPGIHYRVIWISYLVVSLLRHSARW